MANTPITIAVAGSTAHTRWCTQVLSEDDAFAITSVITPKPKLLGRHKVLTENPLHAWATETGVQVTLVQERIDQSIKAALLASERPDILLVVDFGYFIPRWLLEWPKLGPLNIHPSLLPRWRGSSPGQFPLLYGDPTSGITLMIMNEEFDAGPLLHQISFAVDPTWTAKDYYQHAFGKLLESLPSLLKEFAAGALSATAQPEESPTAVAQKLTRADGKVSWSLLEKMISGAQPADQCEYGDVSPVLLDAFSATENIYLVLERASRALSPWPGLWTELPTKSGIKRLKILSTKLDDDDQKLILETVQLEGKTPSTWGQVASIL